MQIGNQMQNHKIETNSELIYEDEAFDRLYFLSKLQAAIHCDSHYHRQRSLLNEFGETAWPLK